MAISVRVLLAENLRGRGAQSVQGAQLALTTAAYASYQGMLLEEAG